MKSPKTVAQRSTTEILNLFPTEFRALDRPQRRLSVAIYRLLACGQPVSVAQLAEASALSPVRVKRILDAWPGVYCDNEGYVIGYWGLALPEMNHRFEVGGRTLYTWCAWDSLFIPEILGKRAHVVSRCPVTAAEIRLTVTPDGIESVCSKDVVMSFIDPDTDEIHEDVIGNFCHYIYFFASLESGEEWIAQNEGTFLLSLDEAYDLGKKKNAVQYAELLSSIKMVG